MAEEYTYVATVKPKGVALADAQDVREFEFTSTETETDALEAQARSHILDNKLIEPSTFRAHWELVSVTPAADDEETDDDTSSGGQPLLQTLKGRLGQQTAADVNRMETHANTSYTTYFEDTTGGRTAVTFVIQDTHYQSFDTWLNSLVIKHAAVRNATGLEFGEAMVRTIADELQQGSLSQNVIKDFNRLRSTHDRFIKTVMRNESTLLSHLQAIQP